MAVKVVETPVLVVGAGPVGLALACELGWRGIGCAVVESGCGAVTFPAGEAIFVRTMEHLRRWGIAGRIAQSPFPADYPRNVVFVTRILGREVARFERPSNAQALSRAGELSPEAHIWCPKMYFDPLLAQFAVSQPSVLLHYRTSMLDFCQDANAVTVRAQGPNGEELQFRSQYLVACDGGRSATRRKLGIEFEGTFAEGHNFSIFFRAKELLERQPHGLASQYLTLASRHRSSLAAVDGYELWRLSLYVDPAEVDAIDPMACLHDAFGASVQAEILKAQAWAGHRVVARSYREGRVFLAGDAAHMLWPKGGFGANTGIGDAVDIGWKLAATLEGWGGPGLLDSYEAERRPIAARNVREAASNRAADGMLPTGLELEEDTPRGEAARAAAGQQIRETRWKEWNTVGVQLGYRYAGSPIVAPDGTPEPPDLPTEYKPTTWPGARAPHAWLRPNTSTLDTFGAGFVLAHDSRRDVAPMVAAASDMGVPFRELRLPASIHGLYERSLVLVRPDGHVAWRGNEVPADPKSILARATGHLT